MPAPRKPKKVLIQFGIALAVAVVLGVVAIVVGFTIITGVTHQAQIAKEEADKRTAEVDAERRRLKEEQENQQQAVRSYKMVQAVVNLEPGQPITLDMITLATSPDRPPLGSLTMLSQALGKMVKSPIIQGEPLDNSKLLDAGGYIMVQDGMRAVCIPVDLIGSINGALVPGSHVDILTSVKEGEQLVTHTLLQNVQVATVGANSNMGSHPQQGADGIPVTVIVTPQQAQKLTLASSLGIFHLTLRNFNDKHTLAIPAEDLTGLMTGLQPSTGLIKKMLSKPAKTTSDTGFHNVNYSPETTNLPSPLDNTPAKSKYSMQIYRGTGSESVDFQQ
jgi:Flp pilus assembly protein CpaB